MSGWRLAHPGDDDGLIEMCARLYREDQGAVPAEAINLRRTLAALRKDPFRGRAVVLEIDGRRCGYALLIAYWSNEFGGEVCAVDELFVVPEHRSQGHATALFDAIQTPALSPMLPVAIALGVTPGNDRAQQLYKRLGFVPVGLSMVRQLS
jgi:GNAT superfamily N-acetyltransferase